MSVSKNIVIHIGFPKTGTTSLQKACVSFPHWDCVCWNTPPEQQESTSPFWQLYRWVASGIHRQKEQVPDERVLRSYLEDEETLDRPLLLTSELFSLANDYPRYKETIDSQEVARRLHGQFPRAKIVMVIRNQLDYLPSLFLQYLERRDLPQKQLSEWSDYLLESPASRCRFADFEALYEQYAKLFGPDNVEVRLYEDFRKDNNVVLDLLLDLAKLSEKVPVASLQLKRLNQRVTRGEMVLLSIVRRLDILKIRQRIPNHLQHALLDWTKSCFKKPVTVPPWTAEQLETMKRLFGPGNQRLATKLGLDLESYGYPLLPEKSD